MKRYHLDVLTPVRPPMADAIYPAQLTASGAYRIVCDIPTDLVATFERWAERTCAVISYIEGKEPA